MDRYKFIRVIGRGTYGIVLQCLDRETKESVAIKCFRKDTPDEYFFQTIIRELRVQQLLIGEDHIVKLLDSFQEGEQIYLVMKYVPRNLLDILETTTKGLEFEALQLLIYTALLGVRSLHSYGLIHRDIKPENILVEDDGTAKLCDFGFARPVFSKQQTTFTPAAFTLPEKFITQSEGKDVKTVSLEKPGFSLFEELVYDCNASYMTGYVATRWYRSPEMLLGMSQYDFVVDVWAIGAIMAEAADGEPLLPGISEIDQLSLIQSRIGSFPQSYKAYLQNLSSGASYEGKHAVGSLSTASSGCEHSDYLRIRFGDILGKLGVDLLQHLLIVDASKRITVEEALQHPFFDRTRARYSLLMLSPQHPHSLVPSKVCCRESEDVAMPTDATVDKKQSKHKTPLLAEPTSAATAPHQYSEKGDPTGGGKLGKAKASGPTTRPEEKTVQTSFSLPYYRKSRIMINPEGKFRRSESNVKLSIPKVRAPLDDTMWRYPLGNGSERVKRKPNRKNSKPHTDSVLLPKPGCQSASENLSKGRIEVRSEGDPMCSDEVPHGRSDEATHGALKEGQEGSMIHNIPQVKNISMDGLTEKKYVLNCSDECCGPQTAATAEKSKSRLRRNKHSCSKIHQYMLEECKTPALRCPLTRATPTSSKLFAPSMCSPYYSLRRGSTAQESCRKKIKRSNSILRKEDKYYSTAAPFTSPRATSREKYKQASQYQEKCNVLGKMYSRRSKTNSISEGRHSNAYYPEKSCTCDTVGEPRAEFTDKSPKPHTLFPSPMSWHQKGGRNRANNVKGNVGSGCNELTTQTPLLFFRVKKPCTASGTPFAMNNLGSNNPHETLLGCDVPSATRFIPIASHLSPPISLSCHTGSPAPPLGPCPR